MSPRRSKLAYRLQLARLESSRRVVINAQSVRIATNSIRGEGCRSVKIIESVICKDLVGALGAPVLVCAATMDAAIVTLPGGARVYNCWREWVQQQQQQQ